MKRIGEICKLTIATAVAVFSVGILLMVVFFNIRPAVASSSPACSTVEVVFARGSGQSLSATESRRVRTQLGLSIEAPLTYNFYELGSQSQTGYQYPAVNVGDVSNGNAIGAVLSNGQANDYGKSVNDGVYELIYYMTDRYTKCASTGSKFFLAGYSQGAQVIGQYIQAAPKEIRDSIAFVSLFGDPKLHLPEGEGFNPPACRGEQLSAYRRVIANCDVDNGSLGARKPYLPDDMHSKTGLWCYAHDFVCGSSKFVWDAEGHGTYGAEGNAIDSAVSEALRRIRSTLPSTDQPYIDDSRPAGDGTTGLDVMFVIDTTGSMSSKIEQTKQFAAAAAERIAALRGRVALVSYRDVGDLYTARIESQFSSDMTEFRARLADLRASGGGDSPEAALHALKVGMEGVSWQHGATKATILLTDETYHEPDLVDGTTLQDIVKLALEIDPVNIYPIVPYWYASNYEALAAGTNGQVLQDSGDTEQALFDALVKLERRPVALLKNLAYRADIGQAITFDASDSYAIDADITEYAWDFDGDGTYDQVTTQPLVRHIYDHAFDGNMQVRLSASNGTIASASAAVKVGTYVPPASPAAPLDLAIVRDDETTVDIAWNSSDDTVAYWIVSSNGVAIGKVPAATTAVTIEDIERKDTVTLEVAGMTADGMMGQSSTSELAAVRPAPQTTVEEPTSPTSSGGDTPASADMLAPADLVAWWDTAPTQSSSSSLLGDATAPVTDIFGAASQQSMGTKSSTGDNTPIFLLAAALLLIIVGLTVKRRRNSID